MGFTVFPGAPDSWQTYWNQITPTGACQWEGTEPQRDQYKWNVVDGMYAFAKDNGYPFKFHGLVWNLVQPSWLTSLPPNEQRQEVEERIATVFQRYPDLDFIDVVNEPINDPAFYKDALGGAGTTGYDWVIWVYQKAKYYWDLYAPNCKLLENEYNMLSGGKINEYLVLINLLKDQDLLDGIGCQAHFLEGKSASTITTNLNKLHATGIPVYISELDLQGNDDFQLAKYQELFPVMWTHPAVKGITLWGYEKDRIWRGGAWLYDRETGYERPALVWLREYLNNAPLGGGTGKLTIDDGNLGYDDSGNWTVSSSGGGNQGDYKHDGNTGATTYKWATFKPALVNQSLSGKYKINVFWKAGTNRATNATVRIYHASGSSSNSDGAYDDYTIDMTQGNATTGQFNQVGGVFTMGSTDYVSINNAGANGFVIADAVQFAKQEQQFSGTYQLEAKDNGKVLHRSNETYASNAAGNYAITFAASTYNGQNWTFESAGSGYYYIKSENNGNYLHESVQSYRSNADGKYVITFPKNATYDGQKWCLESTGDGYYKIFSKQSGKALHNAFETYTSNPAGRYVITFDEQTYDGQKWKLNQLGANNARTVAIKQTKTEEELLTESGFALYPNPAHQTLNLRLPKEGKSQVTVYDLLGRMQLQKELSAQSEATLNITPLPIGIYTVRLQNNNRHYQQRLIVD